MITYISNKLKYFIFFILSVLQLQLSAQDTKNINGLVIAKDATAIENIHVFNITLRKGTITNKKGEFSIDARINDTLVISAIGMKKQRLSFQNHILLPRKELL